MTETMWRSIDDDALDLSQQLQEQGKQQQGGQGVDGHACDNVGLITVGLNGLKEVEKTLVLGFVKLYSALASEINGL